jgi:hypothetical protein
MVRKGASTRKPYAAFVQVMKCSFCSQAQDDHPNGRRLIAGPGGVAICSDCVRLCVKILEATPPEGSPPETWWQQSNQASGDV